jgi:hypothetical protein
MIRILLALGLTLNQSVAYYELARMGRTSEYACMSEIFQAESSWRPQVVGDKDRGGSYGLGQRHAPAHGRPPENWDIRDQVVWFTEYADQRYGGWCEAADIRQEQGWW